MKALTLIQPWAWAIAHAGKDVENRTWSPPAALVGQRIAIHAGRKWDEEAWEMLVDPHLSPIAEDLDDPETGLRAVPDRDSDKMVFGAVVATARLTGVEKLGPGPAIFSRWYGGPVGWLLADVVVLATPVPCRGAQGLWDLPTDVAALIATLERDR